MSQIIFLNGCGSSGKTTIAKAIQHQSAQPWLRLGVDTLIDMAPEKFIAFGEKAAEGYFSFIPGINERGEAMHVKIGPLGDKLFNTLPLTAKLLADAGNNLIIDEVLLDDTSFSLYQKALTGHNIYLIGVFCELHTLQEREILRGDRAIGLANDQFDRVHAGYRPYDLKIDTTRRSAFEIAKEILAVQSTVK
jgi:chloramphenicol 3-O phosphotransferase